MTIDLEKLEEITRQTRIDVLNAVLEMATRAQIEDQAIDDLAHELRQAMEKEMDDAAAIQIKKWLIH